MTINNSANKVIAQGNGATTQFVFNFVGDQPGYISVIYTDASGNETTLTQGNGPTQYQLSLNAAVSPGLWGIGGTVTYAPNSIPIAAGTTLTIFRELPNVQNISLQSLASLSALAESTETGLDQLEMQIQQTAEAQSRVISAPIVDPPTINLVMPPAAKRANTGLAFDGQGNVIAGTTPATGLISSAMQPVVDAASLVLGRTAFGLGSMALENIGSGTGIEDVGDGLARVAFPITNVATNQSPVLINHMTRYSATGPINFTLPRANTLFNGYGFFVKVVGSSATFVANASDLIWSGAQGASGGSLTVAAPAVVFISTDAANSGTWYADVLYPGLSGFEVQKSSAYSVQPTDNGLTHVFTGSSSFTVSVGPTSGFPAAFKLRFYNQSPRGVLLSINAITPFYLYPAQSCVLENNAGELSWNVSPSVQRYSPPAGAVLYVDGSLGSDSNDGLAPGSGGAFATHQNALNVARANFDVLGTGLTINTANGTYNVGAGINMNYLMPLRDITINGNLSSPASVLISCSAGGSCFNARDGATTANINGMTLGTVGNGSTLVSVSQNAVLDLSATGNVNFNAALLGTHMTVTTWASLNIEGGYTINGAAAQHVAVSNNAYVNYGSFTVTGASGMAFTTFASASDCGVISAGGVAMSFSGFSGVSGTRYAANLNGVINSSGTNYPGSTAGVTATGGQYS